MMRLLTTLLLAAACTACGGPSQDGNAFTFDEAGMATASSSARKTPCASSSARPDRPS